MTFHIGFDTDPHMQAARDRIAALEADLARVTGERDSLRSALEVAAPWMHLANDCAAERDTLRAALTECVEALKTVNPWCMVSHRHNTCDILNVHDALAHAQAALADKQD